MPRAAKVGKNAPRGKGVDSPSPLTPFLRPMRGLRHWPSLRQPFSGHIRVRWTGRCLESGLLLPPLAALRRFPLPRPPSLNDQKGPCGAPFGIPQVMGERKTPLRGRQNTDSLWRRHCRSCDATVEDKALFGGGVWSPRPTKFYRRLAVGRGGLLRGGVCVGQKKEHPGGVFFFIIGIRIPSSCR